MNSPQPERPCRADVARSRRSIGARWFACMFSTSDEYETALISERRAQGRYGSARSRWPLAMFVGCALMLAGTVLLLN